ncbi:MAG: RidA family protein [Parvibaculaceae bacterium]
MTKLRAVHLEGTYRSGSPLVPAVIDGTTVHVSGCVPVDLATGTLVGTDVAAQTRQVLKNLERVLVAAGSSLDRVVKTTVFLTAQGDFATMNAVYAEVFGSWLPARSTVVVAALARPGFQVEIEAVATTARG